MKKHNFISYICFLLHTRAEDWYTRSVSWFFDGIGTEDKTDRTKWNERIRIFGSEYNKRFFFFFLLFKISLENFSIDHFGIEDTKFSALRKKKRKKKKNRTDNFWQTIFSYRFFER